ncbi:cryptochrome/photolyase family protein [Mangrovimicrobium sediminis]|uniref:cryptochrome/photolyase family protein n=1 Tax=Mangrovimicrobium sediminis TaxID=2562682 RepID=UPI003211DD93
MTTALYWYRQDLRLADLPAMRAAIDNGLKLIPCYVFDDAAAGQWSPGGASRWWLHHSLAALDTELAKRGSPLVVRRGETARVLADLAAQTGAEAVYCSEAIDPWARELQSQVADALWETGVQLEARPSALLFHPGTVCTQAGDPYRVFTPFWRACLQQPSPAEPLSAASGKHFVEHDLDSLPHDDWQLLPRNPDWAAGWDELWSPGATGARRALQHFLDNALDSYAEGRDFPAARSTSRLSPHLHFGEISPRQVWHAVQALPEGQDKPAAKFLAEVGWREFCHQLLYFNPEIPEKPFKADFGEMPWLADQTHLQAWQRGRTGYPIVDAGMRELWQTGFMHNRVRMIVASFLTKHLLLPWQWGEQWFWDTLVDADLANNSCGWQWVAGCGADAAPYFRIFNPILQGRKFDPDGEYVRQWVPEIASLPDKYLHAPWEAPAKILAEAGVELGETYPEPLVDHKEARETALQAYGVISG